MSLPTLDNIKSGDCILFLGSGFSRAAENVSGKAVKSAWELQDSLLTSCRITDKTDYDLESAAEIFVDIFGDEKIIEVLHKNFQIKSVSRDQETIVCQPWYRIYTTNYDNVIETCCSNKGKKFTNKEIADAVEKPISDVTRIVHIYGNITRSSGSEFRNSFLLTESQRDNSPFITSQWFGKFSDDVLFSRAIIFCGFSIRDLDIKRLLGKLPPEVKQKIHFIDSPKASQPSQQRLSKFGNLHLIGTNGLAAFLQNADPGSPSHQAMSLPPALKKYDLQIRSKAKIVSGDIEFLLTTGLIETKNISQCDIDGLPGSYTFKRSDDHYRRATTFSNYSRPILVHAEIGNGKTVFLNQIAYVLETKNFSVFRINREPEKTYNIIAYLRDTHENTVIIVDDIMNFRTLVKSIIGIGRTNLYVVASVRSTLLRTARPAIEARLGTTSFTEVDLNTTSAKEINYIIKYLEENGLFGDYEEFNAREKERFISHSCGGQVRDVILELFETGVLHDRVQGLLERLSDLTASERDLTILGALLTMGAGREFAQLHFIADMIEYKGSYDELNDAYAKHELLGLIRLDSGEITFRSPALAEFMLKSTSNISEILKVIRRTLVNVSKSYGDDASYDALSRALLKFSLIGKFISNKTDETIIDDFYTECRTLSIARRDPLFLVQRSISNMHFGRFTESYRFVATATGMAKKIPRYDPFQIETHYAKLLLTESIERGFSKDLKKESLAQDLLEGILSRSGDNLYHPLSVMRLYGDLVKRRAHELDISQKAALKRLVDRALVRLNAFPRELRKSHTHFPFVQSNLARAAKQLS